jgi:hypothetical protein
LDVQGDVLAYERRAPGERILIALNLSPEPQNFRVPAWARGARPLLSTLQSNASLVGESIALRPDEGLVLDTHS